MSTENRGAPGRKRSTALGETDRLLLVLPSDLAAAARQAAAAQGITVSEWWRQAGRAALRRRKAGAASIGEPIPQPGLRE